ncbi:MAG TPA: BTAD domain-containing putative transcriptional regulator [Allosphingosinicella sp.]|nr:BTAD domain-containing putative transcriptional regulator [Allosphingosinicella sp.]
MAGRETGEKEARDAAQRFELRCWGRFSLIDRASGQEVAPRGRKARALIAVAASRPGTLWGRERLAAMLWSDRGEEQARASLRQALHELRTLGDCRSPLLEIRRDHVRVDPAMLSEDVALIDRLAGTGDFAAAAETVPDMGSDLFSELEGVSGGFDEWLAAERPIRREALVAAACSAAERAMRAGETGAARSIVNRLAAFEPFNEAAVRLGLLADAATGEASAVEQRYARFCKQLQKELGVGPSAETEAVYRSLFSPTAAAATVGDRAFPSEGAAPAARPAPARWRRTRRLAAAAALLAVLLVTVLAASRHEWGRASPSTPASIAVLPFRDLGTGDGHFAEGVAEEILGQLAREPELRVAGRTSAWTVAAAAGDARSIGQRLNVDYLLEGSVRRAGGNVRVTVALVRAGDGIQIWSETFDGELNDIFLIQHRIGGAVAQNLRRRLVHATPPAGPYATSGEVYRLYVTARSLMRQRQSARTVTAIELLREAVRRDPDYAPAWSRLGAAIAQQQSFAPSPRRGAARAAAIDHVQRALTLAPDLAEAHAAMAIILGADDRAAREHIVRAARLQPNDAEIQLYLGHNLAAAGDFERAFGAFLRAAEIDPYYRPAIGTITRVAGSFGEERRVQPLIARLEQAGGPDAPHFRGHLNWGRGDFSAAAAAFAEALRRVEPHSADFSDMHLAEVFRQLGLATEARRTGRFDEAIWRLWQGELPSLDELARRNRSCAPVPICGGEANDHDGYFAALAVKRLLNAGRGRELAALYDRHGLLALSPGHLEDRPAILVSNGPLLAIVLRQAGRTEEAERLLAAADRAIARITAAGRVPSWFLADSAQTWALQGRGERALAALERALDRGWLYGGFYGGETALADIAEEPAFRSLRGEARFDQVRRRIRSHFERERTQTRTAGLLAAFIQRVAGPSPSPPARESRPRARLG